MKHSLLKIVLTLLTFATVFSSCPDKAYGFNAPAYGDPWYFQSDDLGIMFVVPDKIQHYWGSYALSELGTKHFGPILGALMAFTAGFAWEVRDTYKMTDPTGQTVVGFSTRDLIANGLGVLSSQLSTDDIQFYADYSMQTKQVMFNVSLSFK